MEVASHGSSREQIVAAITPTLEEGIVRAYDAGVKKGVESVAQDVSLEQHTKIKGSESAIRAFVETGKSFLPVATPTSSAPPAPSGEFASRAEMEALRVRLEELRAQGAGKADTAKVEELDRTLVEMKGRIPPDQSAEIGDLAQRVEALKNDLQTEDRIKELARGEIAAEKAVTPPASVAPSSPANDNPRLMWYKNPRGYIGGAAVVAALVLLIWSPWRSSPFEAMETMRSDVASLQKEKAKDETRIVALEARPQGADPEVAKLRQQLVDLQKQFAELEKRPQVVAGSGTVVQPGMTPAERADFNQLQGQVEENINSIRRVSSRVQILEDRPQDDPDLVGRVDHLEGRFDQLEKRAAEPPTPVASATTAPVPAKPAVVVQAPRRVDRTGSSASPPQPFVEKPFNEAPLSGGSWREVPDRIEQLAILARAQAARRGNGQ